MFTTRRHLLSAAFAAPLLAPKRGRLRPGTVSALLFTPLPQERLAFHADRVAGTIVIPVARAAIRAVLPLADREVALLSFAADPAAPNPAGLLDMAAIIGWDGTALRLLALEVLRWTEDAGGGPGARLATRITASGDRSCLLLARDAAAARGALTTRRESWTDLLAWRGGDALADAAARAPAPGTWQAGLARQRACLIARLARRCDVVTDELLVLCRPPELRQP
jgi:hypothetical protein